MRPILQTARLHTDTVVVSAFTRLKAFGWAGIVTAALASCGVTDPVVTPLDLVVLDSRPARAAVDPMAPVVSVSAGRVIIRASVINSANNYPLTGVRTLGDAGSIDLEVRSGPPVGAGLHTIWEVFFEARVGSLKPGTYRLHLAHRAIELTVSKVFERLDTTIVVP